MSFIFTKLEKGCPQNNMLFLIFLSSGDTTMTKLKIIRVFNNAVLQFGIGLSALRAFMVLIHCNAMVPINALSFDWPVMM